MRNGGRMDEPALRVTPTKYEVSVLPLDFDSGYYWTITVEYRGSGLWGIYNGIGKEAYNSQTGEWDFEPSPSNREDDWSMYHRYSLDEALTVAKKLAPDMVLGTRFGPMTPYDAIEKVKRDGYI